jgi:hypothetical protein
MDYFVANTQYNDMKGTAAADEADFESMTKALLEEALISDEEIVIGVSFYHSEGFTFVRAIVASLDSLSAIRTMPQNLDPADNKLVRVLRVDVSLTDFFKLFKRFSVALSLDGFGRALEGVDIDAYESAEGTAS